MKQATFDLIYAVKENKSNRGNLKETAIDFYSEYYDCEKSAYTDYVLFNIIKSAFLDYLSTADNAIYELNNYFEAQRIKMNLTDDIDITNLEIYCMLSVFQLAQVKNKEGKYVNGFGVLSE